MESSYSDLMRTILHIFETGEPAFRCRLPNFSVIPKPDAIVIVDLLALWAGDQCHLREQFTDDLRVADALSYVSLELVQFSHEELRQSIGRFCCTAIQ